jgi:hypothetical protein
MPELRATLLVVQRCLPHGATLACVDVDEAISTAHEFVGPNQRQVSITAHTADVDSFAIRHFTFEHDEIRDCGWRCWVDGLFAGDGSVVNAAPAERRQS